MPVTRFRQSVRPSGTLGKRPTLQGQKCSKKWGDFQKAHVEVGCPTNSHRPSVEIGHLSSLCAFKNPPSLPPSITFIDLDTPAPNERGFFFAVNYIDPNFAVKSGLTPLILKCLPHEQSCSEFAAVLQSAIQAMLSFLYLNTQAESWATWRQRAKQWGQDFMC